MLSNQDIILYRQVLLDAESQPSKEGLLNFKALFLSLLESMTDDSKIVFVTLYSRLSYLISLNNFEGKFSYLLHKLRRIVEEREIGNYSEEEIINLYRFCTTSLIDFVEHKKPPSVRHFENYARYREEEAREVLHFKHIIKAYVTSIDTDNKRIEYESIDEDGVKWTVIYDVSGKNDLYTKNIENLVKYGVLPIAVNFIDCDILGNDECIPRAIIVNPDFLIDVTAIASLSSEKSGLGLLYLLSKYRPRSSSMPLLIGNIANYMMDDLIRDPELLFQDFLKTLFQREAMSLVSFTDEEIGGMISLLKIHFFNLQNVVKDQFVQLGFDANNLYLEPSFYSRDYGIQGRLDIFKNDKKERDLAIVELKSGKPYNSNVYGINPAHYTQSLLYEMMVRSCSFSTVKINTFILYSSLSDSALRHAPIVKSQQNEAMRLRNDLIMVEYLMTDESHLSELLSLLKPDNFPQLFGFLKRDLTDFYKIMASADSISLAYFISFSSFVAREFTETKIGEQGIYANPGNAGLWQLSYSEKEERYTVLRALEISSNEINHDDPIVILNRTTETSISANFREGDVVALYPDIYKNRAPDNGNLIKGAIISIDTQSVKIRLRNRQINLDIFNSEKTWIIEADSFDSSFNTMYRNLYEFLTAPKTKRDLILGMELPRASNQSIEILHEPKLTEEQNIILSQIINANDYYLLWGPPGTGKTSVMVRQLVKYYLENGQDILLTAYTNRAVDELCDAIASVSKEAYKKTIRIGSQYSTSASHREILLNEKISFINKRSDLVKTIDDAKIIVGTLSSLLGKPEIFELKNFEIGIVDEASQILEPMLCGLISKIKKFVLIGDHKQLPAVVTQSPEKASINAEVLNEIGITSGATSLFERLYTRLLAVNNVNNHGQLTHQGRMHVDIMELVNQHFYDGKLRIIDKIKRLSAPHEENFPYSSRTVYIPTDIETGLNWKTNQWEAAAVADIIEKLIKSGYVTNVSDIGVITLYRAQISCIRNAINAKNISQNLDNLTIDTVERYQGSARKIIILSLCTNKLNQIKSIVSLSEDGTDRKLNVAITRAQEAIFMIGNENVLKQNEVYADLIETFSTK